MEAEKRRLEEQRRLKQEALQREEKARQERELAKKQEKERKAEEKARKREERERLEAAAGEKRKQEQEAERVRKEQSRQEALRQKQEALKQKEPKTAQSVEAQESREEIRATILMNSPAQAAPKTSATDVSAEASAESGPRPNVSQSTPGTRKAVYITAAVVVLLAAAILAWRALVPHTIATQVTTTPEGATVSITSKDHAGQSQKCVPTCSFNLRPGKYSVEAKLEGYENAQTEIEVGANISNTHTISLVTPPPPPPPPQPTLAEMVVLKVRGLTGGSELFVDNKSMGRVGHNGEMSVKVPAGSHEVRALVKQKNSSIVVRNFAAGGVVSLTQDDLFPRMQAPEDLDWQTALVSGSIGSIEKFLKKYPNGNHRVEAGDMLEKRYWERDLQANSVESYRDFLQRYPQGSHAPTAREELAFLTVDRNDPASLDALTKNYGNSRHRAEIDHLRDELAWQRTKQKDESSLEAYVGSFPNGGHAAVAKAKLADLRDDAHWQRTNRNDQTSLEEYLSTFPEGRHAEEARAILVDVRDESAWLGTNRGDKNSLNKYLNAFPEGKHAKEAKKALAELHPPQPPVDSRAEIIAALERYKRAYEHVSFNEMTEIWPGAPRSFKEVFADLKGATLSYGVVGDPNITGDTAVVTIDQALTALPKNGVSTNLFKKRLTVTLHKSGNAQGPNPVWLIDSINAK